ncbi:ABC transporter substrate-binding protein [Microbacterium sp.]|uniref:ABC transporter substrate-binding protein n=1 Tax=Microbacterium sp. TaxID=51671 RepID=UPI003C7120C1
MRFARRAAVPVALLSVLAIAGCSAPAATSDKPQQEETRTVETVFGEVDVPVDPQRIVIVQSAALDAALALGIEPVGSTFWGGAGGVPEYLQDQVPADFTLVGNEDEPDFEAIAALEPDLIIATEAAEENLATFEDIAPVAAFAFADENGDSDWRGHVTQIADFTGREEQAEEVLADFDALIAELDAEVAVPGETVIPLRVRADHVRHYLPLSFVGADVLQSLSNIELPDSKVASENGEWAVIPAERLDVLDSDRIIAFIDSQEAYDTLQAQSLWQGLPAVQNGKVCVTENLVAWILGGPSAAKVVADDVRECLAA